MLKRGGSIKTDIKGKECEDMNRVHLVQDRVQWWNGVSTIMNFGFSKGVRDFLLTS
jgi:hypothetical protein